MWNLHHALYDTIAAGAGLLLVAAAVQDVVHRIIPNTACVGLVLIGVMLRLQDGWIIWGVLLALLIFGAAVLCWRRGWMGGGDVKLLGAVALVVPPQQVGSLLLLIAQCGGVLALVYLVLSKVIHVAPAGQLLGPLGRIWRAERWRICRGAPLPYGLAIAFGGITLLLTGS